MRAVFATFLIFTIILHSNAELSQSELTQLRAQAEQEAAQLLGPSLRSVDQDATISPLFEKATMKIEAYLRKNAVKSSPSPINRRMLSTTSSTERTLLSKSRQSDSNNNNATLLSYFTIQQDTSFDIENNKNIKYSYFTTTDPSECSAACYNRMDCYGWTIKLNFDAGTGCYLRGANYTTSTVAGWTSGALLPEYQWQSPGIPPQIALDPNPSRYADVLKLTKLFFDAQRSGPIPPNYVIPWRNSSNLNDPVVGGWYDAADTLKASLPMGVSVSFLSWSMLNFPDVFKNNGIFDSYLSTIRVATDYLMACYNAADNTFVGQIGNPRLEADYWGRPEEESIDRPAYIYNGTMKASDLLSAVSAALSSTSIVVRPTDPTYADQLLNTAKAMYTQAITHEGKYSDYYKDSVYIVYPSSDIMDNQMWGAAWLYRATNDKKYLQQANTFWKRAIKANPRGADVFVGWDSLWAPAIVLLRQFNRNGVKVPGINSYNDWWYKTFSPAWLKADGKYDIISTPLGMKYADWNQYANFAMSSAASMSMLQDAKFMSNEKIKKQEINFAKQQIDYILGSNGRSFVVNWGATPPSHPHHASSSCADLPARCDWQNYYMRASNYQVLNGAIAGGPGGKLRNATNPDYWADVRTDFATNEPSLDLVSAFAASLAGLASMAV